MPCCQARRGSMALQILVLLLTLGLGSTCGVFAIALLVVATKPMPQPESSGTLESLQNVPTAPTVCLLPVSNRPRTGSRSIWTEGVDPHEHHSRVTIAPGMGEPACRE